MNNIVVFFRWILWDNKIRKGIFHHLSEFLYIWLFLFLLFVAACLASCYWDVSTTLIGILLALTTLLVLIQPMNAVYGLMGTSGSIRLFFLNFIVITLLFAGIYQRGFFKDAGISYDVNQPHIDYNLYADGCPMEAREVGQSDTICYKKMVDSMWVEEVVVQETKRSYQPIGFWFTWKNTILTTLMQEPTDFFQVASTYNESMVDASLCPCQQAAEISLDRQKAKFFQWILIFQVLISWIFFGVFISLLYNKFRYES